MQPSDLGHAVRARLVELEFLGGTGEDVTIRHLLNWGGFVNRSFAASDAVSSYHVKLADNPHSASCLRRWESVGGPLAERYRAPFVQGWINIPGTPFEGLVLEWIDGATPSKVASEVRAQAVDVIHRLHSDTSLADRLLELGASSGSCADAYLATYHDRFVEDLKEIRATPPPFVKAEALEWMANEAEQLLEYVLSNGAFADPACGTIHADLWLNNLLVEPDGTLRIVDWDDVGVGDPMMDWAMLFGPSRFDLSGTGPGPGVLPGTSANEDERLALYTRAALLDWIIDPLADWIEARRDPVHRDRVREANERVHQTAIARYRSEYP